MIKRTMRSERYGGGAQGDHDEPTLSLCFPIHSLSNGIPGIIHGISLCVSHASVEGIPDVNPCLSSDFNAFWGGEKWEQVALSY